MCENPGGHAPPWTTPMVLYALNITCNLALLRFWAKSVEARINCLLVFEEVLYKLQPKGISYFSLQMLSQIPKQFTWKKLLFYLHQILFNAVNRHFLFIFILIEACGIYRVKDTRNILQGKYRFKTIATKQDFGENSKLYRENTISSNIVEFENTT